MSSTSSCLLSQPCVQAISVRGTQGMEQWPNVPYLPSIFGGFKSSQGISSFVGLLSRCLGGFKSRGFLASFLMFVTLLMGVPSSNSKHYRDSCHSCYHSNAACVGTCWSAISDHAVADLQQDKLVVARPQQRPRDVHCVGGPKCRPVVSLRIIRGAHLLCHTTSECSDKPVG